MEPINGHPEPLPEDALRTAQGRLAQACMRQPMTPSGVAISAFVNGTLAKVALDALMEYVLTDADAKARFTAIMIEHLEAKSTLLENTAREAPRIIATAGHG